MSIKISIGSLKEGSQDLVFEVPPAELGIADSHKWGLSDNVTVDLELFKSDHQLDIRALITGKMKLECDRCLDLYERKIEQELELVYVIKSPREDEYNDDYMRTYYPHMKTIDITNDIKEMIVLAVPMKQVPPENEDGSCSWCGRTKQYWQQFIVDEEELENK